MLEEGITDEKADMKQDFPRDERTKIKQMNHSRGTPVEENDQQLMKTDLIC